MSYDLFIFADIGKPMPSLKDFVRYLRTRKHYKIDKNFASYTNPDTGVYFSFNYIAKKPKELVEDPTSVPQIAFPVVYFSINYNRPRSFIVEAEPEVTALIRKFGLCIDDPQVNGMARHGYTPEGLIHGWQTGNEMTRWNRVPGEISLSCY